MVIKTADEVHELIKDVLLAVGADERNADCVAEHLVSANLSGVDTHGINMLPRYVKAIKAGYIDPTALPEITSETPTSARVASNGTFGQVAAKFALEVGIEKATRENVAVIALTHAHHIGRLGHYTEYTASVEMISMICAGGFSEVDPIAVPFGGRKRVLHTNPISMGFPTNEEPPLVFDYATTASSRVKVVYAQQRNQPIPLDWVVDRDGNPTTNPDDFLQGGGLAPFGEHKGFALMMAVEYLSRIFTHAERFSTQGWVGPSDSCAGVAMVVFRADLFDPVGNYKDKADELVRRVRAVPPAPGFKEVLVPGDMEHRTRCKRKREGIPIPDDIWETIHEMVSSLGLDEVEHQL